MLKNKLTIDEQIEKMKSSGVKFNIVTEEDAREFLLDSTYYFKLKAFQKNYNKKQNGDYINLEFAYLKDFSTVDMWFRKLVLSLALGVEHSMKVKLNADISNNPAEDGYSIVNEFLNTKEYSYIVKSIYAKVHSNYAGELIKKYCSYTYNPNSQTPYYFECPFWVFTEILSFGDFINLYNYYYNKHKMPNALKPTLFSIRCLRNAAAHNNCVLNSLKKSDHTNFTVNNVTNSFVSKIDTISVASRKNCMAVPALHDFAALLMSYSIIVNSKAAKMQTLNDLKDFMKRFSRHFEYYNSNDDIKKPISFFKNLLTIMKKTYIIMKMTKNISYYVSTRAVYALLGLFFI